MRDRRRLLRQRRRRSSPRCGSRAPAPGAAPASARSAARRRSPAARSASGTPTRRLARRARLAELADRGRVDLRGERRRAAALLAGRACAASREVALIVGARRRRARVWRIAGHRRPSSSSSRGVVGLGLRLGGHERRVDAVLARDVHHEAADARRGAVIIVRSPMFSRSSGSPDRCRPRPTSIGGPRGGGTARAARCRRRPAGGAAATSRVSSSRVARLRRRAAPALARARDRRRRLAPARPAAVHAGGGRRSPSSAWRVTRPGRSPSARFGLSSSTRKITLFSSRELLLVVDQILGVERVRRRRAVADLDVSDSSAAPADRRSTCAHQRRDLRRGEHRRVRVQEPLEVGREVAALW